MRTQTTLGPLAALLSVLIVGAGSASAEFVVTMTGTVEKGTLNDASIDGSDFVVTATTASDIDLSAETDIGAFQLSQAVMQIGASSQFVFDTSTTFFAQRYNAPTTGSSGEFATGFLDDPSSIVNQFGYNDFVNTVLPTTFNPNDIQTLSYNMFDAEFALPSSTSAVFTNGGDTLALSALALPGSLTIVPEPSTFAYVAIGVICLATRARRTRRSYRR